MFFGALNIGWCEGRLPEGVCIGRLTEGHRKTQPRGLSQIFFPTVFLRHVTLAPYIFTLFEIIKQKKKKLTVANLSSNYSRLELFNMLQPGTEIV